MLSVYERIKTVIEGEAKENISGSIARQRSGTRGYLQNMLQSHKRKQYHE